MSPIWKAASMFIMAVGLAGMSGCGNDQENGLTGEGVAKTSTSILGTAVIEGKITLRGTTPHLTHIDFSADPVCSSQHEKPVKDDSVVVGAKGGLANVFVYIKEGAGSYGAPSTPVTLEQKGCMYLPHIFGIQTGQPLEIVNDDSTLHNIHCMAVTNDPFNVGQPTQGMSTMKKFNKPEVMVKFKCDVHGWMHCYGGVLTNPFYSVSEADGSYKITGLPAGNYTVEAWQERFGTLIQKVDVKDGESKKIDFAFAIQ